MEFHVAAAVLLAALLHASWNALIRVNADRLVTLGVMSAGAGLAAGVTIPFVSFPAAQAWPWLLVSLCVHTGYKLCLLRAYAHGEFGHVYPLARGGAPLLVTIASVAVVGERLDPMTLLAVLVLAGGVISLAFRGGVRSFSEDPRPALWALATACFIATYSVLDALGARAAGSPHGFAAWLFLLDGAVMFVIVLWRRRSAAWQGIARFWRPGLAGGAMSLAAYWLVIWAMTVAPMAPVSALRETSVLFAALISVLVLRESFGAVRMLASLCVMVGIALLLP